MLKQIMVTWVVGMIGAVIGSVVVTLALALTVMPSLPRLPGAQQLVLAPSVEEGMSRRAVAQYRAFYAEQLASESALERWALSTPSALRQAAQGEGAHLHLLASEADLGSWTATTVRLAAAPAAEPPARPTDGVQFK